MKRILTLSKFRNIGLDKPEHFIINTSLEKDKIGDLVILIGANNSGKSNILDALDITFHKKLEERDVTTLSFNQEDRVPQLIFEVSDNSINAKFKTTYSQANQYITKLDNESKNSGLDDETWKTYLQTIITQLAQLRLPVDELQQILEEGSIEHNLLKIIRVFNTYYNGTNVRDVLRASNYSVSSSFTSNFANICLKNLDNPIIKYFLSNNNNNIENDKTIADNYLQKTYGIPFIPSVYRYKEKNITSDNMETTPNYLQNNDFFKAIFKAINLNIEDIKLAYEQYNKFHNKQFLKNISHKINDKFNSLNSEFNRMYFAEKDKYNFSIDLESSKISFTMARGENSDPIMIEYQSTGFKWFFNLYFNFLCTDNLKVGDIVIMDEPATNLHPHGQVELRRFIKEFAIRNGITFIIATHSPFLISTDNYDELRVISMNNNKTKIDNLFSAVNIDDPDSLLPIKEALTIKQNILYDFETQVVWVEGITDYNYLTMFKQLFNYNKIAFIPFKGVGKNKEQQLEIIRRIKNITLPKRLILTDGDKAGLAFKAACVDTCFEKDCVSINDLSTDTNKFEEIEDLFSAEDKNKYASLQKGTDDFKKANYTSTMKKYCKLEDFSQETINNFKKLFELLTE